jgi:Ser/Thr protein kinase RdoA (MazF antagonist)
VVTVDPCRYGNEALAIVLRTTEGSVVAKAQPLPGDDLVAEGLVLGALRDGGCPVPRLLFTGDGTATAEADGWRWLLLHRLEGVHLRAGRYPPGTLERLGGELARVHRTLAGSPVWRHPRLVGRTARGAAYLHTVADLVRRHHGVDVRRVRQFERAYDEVLPLLAGLRRLRPGPVHSDVSFDNVIVGEQVHLLDFGDVGHGTVLFDVATAVLNLCAHGHRVRTADAGALLAGYLAVAPELAAELPSLVDALRFVCVRKQASYLNYLLTRAQVLRKNLTFFGKYEVLRARTARAVIARLVDDLSRSSASKEAAR